MEVTLTYCGVTELGYGVLCWGMRSALTRISPTATLPSRHLACLTAELCLVVVLVLKRPESGSRHGWSLFLCDGHRAYVQRICSQDQLAQS